MDDEIIVDGTEESVYIVFSNVLIFHEYMVTYHMLRDRVFENPHIFAVNGIWNFFWRFFPFAEAMFSAGDEAFPITINPLKVYINIHL